MRTPQQEAISRGMKAWWARRRREDYAWQDDAIASYSYALHMKALAIGSKRFKTISEMYWQERHGIIP